MVCGSIDWRCLATAEILKLNKELAKISSTELSFNKLYHFKKKNLFVYSEITNNNGKQLI
jgi:hypothetical protein